MASQLRRTLHLSVLCSAVLLVIASCHNTGSEKQEIVQKFDSVDQKLKNEDTVINNPDINALYDTVAVKYTPHMMGEFKSAVTEFKTYIQSLKKEFVSFCGGTDGKTIPEDRQDDENLTKTFFKKDNKGEDLYYKLSDIQTTLSSYNDDPAMEEEITEMVRVPKHGKPDKFYKLYFNNVPPVAILTILSKFETDVIMFERKIVQSFLKNNHAPR